MEIDEFDYFPKTFDGHTTITLLQHCFQCYNTLNFSRNNTKCMKTLFKRHTVYPRCSLKALKDGRNTYKSHMVLNLVRTNLIIILFSHTQRASLSSYIYIYIYIYI